MAVYTLQKLNTLQKSDHRPEWMVVGAGEAERKLSGPVADGFVVVVATSTNTAIIRQ